MTTKPQRPAKNAGKPTISPEDRDETVGQRDRAPDKQGDKPAIGPDKHDNYGQRGTLVADDNDVE